MPVLAADTGGVCNEPQVTDHVTRAALDMALPKVLAAPKSDATVETLCRIVTDAMVRLGDTISKL